jgi:hypothetical protein
MWQDLKIPQKPVKCGEYLIHSPLVEFLTNFLQKNCIKSSVNIYLGFTQKQAIQLCCQNWVDSPYISTVKALVKYYYRLKNIQSDFLLFITDKYFSHPKLLLKRT